ncbi:DeoR/GlpR family DNA-binding transcription regulator [Rhizobium sp. FKL33]|uniref:DeoR/GlpR family DNA-binding transcription regulator n=1 Tax=Rhizobium sp. FKL33 TaxID=2562307 RepID=UPI0010C09BDF|nr:DeoR/GlpR family DNA-binding transcription regulator [Rhizobium sp. FKL33]
MNMSAIPQERHELILKRLEEDGRVLASTLARELGATEDTIRRDLRELAKAGRCQRVYGGALPIIRASASLQARDGQGQARKAALARAAVKIVQPGDTLLIDAGSTNTAIARALPEGQSLTVITNAPAVANLLLGRNGVDVMVIGGRLDHRTGGTLGARALDELRRLKVTLCFPGICAVSVADGITAFDQEDAFLKEAMMQASAAVVAVTTTDKMETRAPFGAAPIASITHLVVEAGADPAGVEAFAKAGVAIHIAEEARNG